MSKRKWLKRGGEVGVIFLGIAFAVNAVVSIFGDPMDDCIFPAIEKRAGIRQNRI